MRCQKCGKRLRRNEKFCTSCGYYNEDENDLSPDDWDDGDYDLLSEEDNEYTEDNKKENQNIINYEFEEEKDIEAYIGEDYRIIKKSPFNIWAFLLNWMYVLYRKLYITGILGLTIALILVLFSSKYIIIYLIISMVILGFIFNPYYIFVIKQRIKRLEKTHEGSDSYTFTKICEEKGGVNIPIALIIYFIFLVIIIVSSVGFNFSINNNHNTKFWNENSENKANCNYFTKVAYNDYKNENDITIEEALCSITKVTTKEYNIYLKAKKDKKTIYIYYETENLMLKYIGDEEEISKLEEKEKNKTITDEEKEILNKIKNIQKEYKLNYNKSLEEDKLIEENKDTKEKYNYIFTREEVIR